MIYPDNVASTKVATHIGMTFEWEAVDEHGPYHIYSMTRLQETSLMASTLATLPWSFGITTRQSPITPASSALNWLRIRHWRASVGCWSGRRG